MFNADLIVGEPPLVETKHPNEHAKVSKSVGWFDCPEGGVLVFSWEVALSTHIHSHKTEATVEPLAFLEFHSCAVVLLSFIHI